MVAEISMKNYKIFKIIALLLLSLPLTASAQDDISPHGFPLGTIHIQTAYGDTLSLNVEVARTSRDRAKGLMHRETLGDIDGMLFIWQNAALRQFWMKNTPLSLDILFFDEDGTLVHMAEAQKPFSESLIHSLLPAKYVLELPAGDSARRHIALGDRLIELPK